VSSLGYDIVTSCAAARAGLVRPSILENFRIRSAEEGREEPVLGHSAKLLTTGYEGNARICRLIQGCLNDLMAQNSDHPWQGKRHRFYLALGDPFRTQTEEITSQETSVTPTAIEDRLKDMEKEVIKAIGFSNWNGETEVGSISIRDRIGPFEAIETAIADLLSGTVEFAIVLGADSLLDEDTLTWLHQSGRLKCDGVPLGMQPGEAGVSILLTLDDQAKSNVHPKITVAMPAINQKGNALNSDQPLNGEGLAEAISSATNTSDRVLAQAWLVSDHNGEYRMANEWGHTLVRLRAIDQIYAAPTFWYPVASFGETGAACVLLSICMVCRAFERNYGVSDTAVVTATSTGKERGAIALLLN